MRPRDVLPRVILKGGYSHPVRHVLNSSPFDPTLTRRFVGGPDIASAVAAARALDERGMRASLHYRDAWVRSTEAADAHVAQYAALTEALAVSGVTEPEISIKLEQLGLYASGGEDAAVERALRVTRAAYDAGVAVTVDMEGIDEIDLTLAAVRTLREHRPDVGAVLQAYLPRTERDCAELSGPGSRVRLCKGGYAEHGAAVYSRRPDIDRSFVRCMNVLMRGDGHPMIASHDDRLIRIARSLADSGGREPRSWELQMLQGIRPHLAQRLVRSGSTMRVYVAYGPQWYPWFVRRLSEKPANLALLGRALVPGS